MKLINIVSESIEIVHHTNYYSYLHLCNIYNKL